MRCYNARCGEDAVTEMRVRYARENGTESDAVWEPLCDGCARNVTQGFQMVLGQPRPLRWTGQRPLEDHQHDYRIMSQAPVRIAGAVTGYTDIDVCPCGDRRIASPERSAR